MGRKRISNSHWVSGGLIIILATLIFFAPSYGWDIRQFLSPSAGSGNAGADASQTDAANVSAENEALKAQLAQLQVVASQLPTSSPDQIRAMVYSRYPMNFRNELLVNAGSNNGVAVGAAVIFQGVLIGQIKSVFPNSAIVQTIFDNNLKMPVRIGAGGYDGLLEGGSEPTVGSIASGAAVSAGDVVYSATPGLPYGLPIAEVVATSTSADSLFEQTTLNFSYDINTIQTVFIAQ
jgi:cell shape-determining protein MreC